MNSITSSTSGFYPYFRSDARNNEQDPVIQKMRSHAQENQLAETVSLLKNLSGSENQVTIGQRNGCYQVCFSCKTQEELNTLINKIEKSLDKKISTFEGWQKKTNPFSLQLITNQSANLFGFDYSTDYYFAKSQKFMKSLKEHLEKNAVSLEKTNLTVEQKVIFSKVFKNCDIGSLYNLSQVCKEFQGIANKELRENFLNLEHVVFNKKDKVISFKKYTKDIDINGGILMNDCKKIMQSLSEDYCVVCPMGYGATCCYYKKNDVVCMERSAGRMDINHDERAFKSIMHSKTVIKALNYKI